MLLSKEQGMAGLLQPDMSWDNNDGIVPSCHNPSRATSQGHLARSFCEARGSNKGIIHGTGKVPDAFQCHRPNSNWLLQTNPCLGKRTKNSQNE